MRRRLLAALLALLLVVLVAAPVSAADDDDEGWWLTSLLSGIGSFFSSLLDGLKSLGTMILDGLKALFIPRDSYFTDVFERISNKFSEKFGGILSMGNELSSRFSSMQAYNMDNMFVAEFPKDHLLNGGRVNLIAGLSDVLPMLRGALSGFLVLITAMFCYRKVVDQVNS